MVQAATKSVTNFALRVVGSHRPRPAPAAASSSRRPGRRGCRPLQLAGLAVAALEHVLGLGDRLPRRAHVEQVDEEVVGQRPGPLGEHPVLRPADIGVRAPACRRPAPSSPGRSASSAAPCRPGAPPASRCSRSSGSCGTRPPSARARRRSAVSVCSCVASVRPGVNGTSTACPALLRSLLDRGAAAQHDQVGERHLLSARLRRR